jgi:hypothetical protein
MVMASAYLYFIQNKEGRLERSCFGYAGIDGRLYKLSVRETVCEVLTGFRWFRIGSDWR